MEQGKPALSQSLLQSMVRLCEVIVQVRQVPQAIPGQSLEVGTPSACLIHELVPREVRLLGRDGDHLAKERSRQIEISSGQADFPEHQHRVLPAGERARSVMASKCLLQERLCELILAGEGGLCSQDTETLPTPLCLLGREQNQCCPCQGKRSSKISLEAREDRAGCQDAAFPCLVPGFAVPLLRQPQRVLHQPPGARLRLRGQEHRPRKKEAETRVSTQHLIGQTTQPAAQHVIRVTPALWHQEVLDQASCVSKVVGCQRMGNSLWQEVLLCVPG